MAEIKIPVKIQPDKGFEAVKREAAKADRELKKQIRDRQRLLNESFKAEANQYKQRQAIAKELARAERDDRRAADRAIKAKFDAQRRENQQNDRLQRDIVRKQKAAELAAERELKKSISDRQRLVRLSAKLEKDITREQRQQEKALKAQNDQRRRNQQVRTGRMAQAGGAAALAAGVTVTVAAELSKNAAAAERLDSATGALGRRFGVTGDQIVDSIQEASSFTINRMDAMRAANQAMLLGVVDNEEQFAELAQISIALGRAMGQDATKSLEDLTTALGRQSNLILDNLGIIVDTEKAYETYASSIGKSASELTDSEKQQAFTNAALEAGREAMDELGGVTLDTAGKYERLNARFDDLKTGTGELINIFLSSSGALDALNETLDRLIATAEGVTFIVEQTSLLNQAIEETNKTGNETLDTWNGWIENAELATAAMNPLGFVMQTAAEKAGTLAFSTEEVAENYNELAEAAEDAEKALDWRDLPTTGLPEEVSKSAEELEEEARRLERVSEIRRDAIREILDIDKQIQEDTAEAWKDFFDSQEDDWQDYQKRIAKGRKGFAKDMEKIDRDLSKDLAKLEKNARKDVEKLKKDAKRDEKNERKRRQIDTLADERLFNFELRQLAADGDALQIQEALERRAIEEDIARDKAAVEKEIEDEKLSDDIIRVKEAASERKAELEAEAAEARELRQQELEEKEAEEEESFFERLEKLREYREEKLSEIEASREESLEALTDELVQAGDLTRKELEELAPAVAKIGEKTGHDYGSAFNEGLKTAIENDDMVRALLGDFTGRDFGQTDPEVGNPQNNTLPGFADGGSFVIGGSGGTDSQIVAFRGTPGEKVEITPPGQSGGGININIPVTVIGGGVNEQRIAAIAERKAQELVSELEEMLN